VGVGALKYALQIRNFVFDFKRKYELKKKNDKCKFYLDKGLKNINFFSRFKPLAISNPGIFQRLQFLAF
jgi:hypothetical protein